MELTSLDQEPYEFYVFSLKVKGLAMIKYTLLPPYLGIGCFIFIKISKYKN